MGQYIRKYFGWRNWAVFQYNSIFENLFLVYFILLDERAVNGNSFLRLILFLVFSMLSTTYGYLINDFADRELDARHHKANTFDGDTPRRALQVVILAFSLSVVSAIPFIGYKLFNVLFLSWLFTTTFYSLPPLRFKERGTIGLVIAAISQRLLPILMLFAVFDLNNAMEWVLFGLYVLNRGLLSDMQHQIADFENDLKSNVQTSAVAIGKKKLERYFQILLWIDRYLLLLILIYFAFTLNQIQIAKVPLFYIPPLFYAVLVIISLFLYRKAGGMNKNPFAPPKNIFQVLHLVFPNVLLPLFFIAILGYFNSLFWLMFIWYLLMLRLYDPVVIKNTFFYRQLFKPSTSGNKR